MKPRISLIAALSLGLAVGLLLLMGTACSSSGTAPTATLPSLTSVEQAESDGEPVETDTHSVAAVEGTELRVSSEQSGQTLLQDRCARCHSVKLLERTRKSRAEWEKILSRMERYSGLVDENERLLVLDQLVGPAKP